MAAWNITVKLLLPHLIPHFSPHVCGSRPFYIAEAAGAQQFSGSKKMPCRIVDWDHKLFREKLVSCTERSIWGASGTCSSLPSTAQPLGSSASLAIPPTVPLQLMLSFPPNWHISHSGFQSAAEHLEEYGWIQGTQLQNLELSLWLQQGRSTLKLCSGTDNHFSHWFIKHMVSLRHRSQLPVPSFISARLLCGFLPGISSKYTRSRGCNKSLAWVTPALRCLYENYTFLTFLLTYMKISMKSFSTQTEIWSPLQKTTLTKIPVWELAPTGARKPPQ